MSDELKQELLAVNQRLLEAIIHGDWKTYIELCDPSITAFEPEASEQLVSGLAFHRFYFELGRATGPRQVTMASPWVRVMGDVAIVCYVRLIQKVDSSGLPTTIAFRETRVWQKKDGAWRHVHFHRSSAGGFKANG
jgi:ketosteroid isomerase-like protein